VVRLFFTEGQIQRLVAIGEAMGGDAEIPDRLDPATRAVASSADFRLTADSIEAIAPNQVLDRVVAVGDAYGERVGSELANAAIPTIAARDWMRGDTVIAVFEESDELQPDVESERRARVDRVIAIGVGDRATSTYRVQDEADPDGEPGINYMLARRITIQMRDEGVEAVEAEGEVQGMYLQPSAVAGATRPSGGGGGRR
jgi:hypothetical protein